MKREILLWLGLYLIADGLISIIYFKESSTNIENFFRWVRTAIGLYLYWNNKNGA